MDPNTKKGLRTVNNIINDKNLSREDKKSTLRSLINVYSTDKDIVLQIEKFLGSNIVEGNKASLAPIKAMSVPTIKKPVNNNEKKQTLAPTKEVKQISVPMNKRKKTAAKMGLLF